MGLIEEVDESGDEESHSCVAATLPSPGHVMCLQDTLFEIHYDKCIWLQQHGNSELIPIFKAVSK